MTFNNFSYCRCSNFFETSLLENELFLMYVVCKGLYQSKKQIPNAMLCRVRGIY